MGVELLYNSVKTKVKLVPVRVRGGDRRDGVGKATTGRRGSGPPIELRSREDADKMQERKPSPSRVGLWASGWASGEQERHNADGHKKRVKILQFLFGLTRKPWITLSNPCNNVRGTYFYKESSLVCLFIVSLWCCRWQYNPRPICKHNIWYTRSSFQIYILVLRVSRTLAKISKEHDMRQ